MLHSPWAFTARDARPNDWSGAIVKSQLLGASSMPGRRCPKLPSHRGRTVGWQAPCSMYSGVVLGIAVVECAHCICAAQKLQKP